MVIDDKTLITITPEWMKQKFDEMNELLFDNVLGDCKFSLFTSGKGSEGGILGWFKIKPDFNVTSKYHLAGHGRVDGKQYYERVNDGTGYDEYFMVHSETFPGLMHPEIQLNGNYNWTEKSALSTLVHEMCHYLQHIEGFYEGVGTYKYNQRTRTNQVITFKWLHHGNTFLSVANKISKKAASVLGNGIFTVESIASAEQMKQVDFTDQKKEQHNKKAAKGITFYKLELTVPAYIKGKRYGCEYAIPASTIAGDLAKTITTLDPNKFKRVVRCVTTDGNIMKYPFIKSVTRRYYALANTVDEVMPDVKVDYQEDVILGQKAKLDNPLYIFRMKYKNSPNKWGFYVVDPVNYFAIRNYLTNSQKEYVYADYCETYDPKALEWDRVKIKQISVHYLSNSENIMPEVEKSAFNVLFNNVRPIKESMKLNRVDMQQILEQVVEQLAQEERVMPGT